MKTTVPHPLADTTKARPTSTSLTRKPSPSTNASRDARDGSNVSVHPAVPAHQPSNLRDSAFRTHGQSGSDNSALFGLFFHSALRILHTNNPLLTKEGVATF